MAYIHQVRFVIGDDQMDQLRIGAALERTLGYLRTLLPNQPGFVTAQAMYRLETPGQTHVVVQSTWDQWEDLEAHRHSELAEQKVLSEFKPHVAIEDVTVHIYDEVP